MTSRSLALPEIIDLVAVGPMHKALLDLRGVDLIIDAGAVRQINGLGLQLMIAAEATWMRDGHNLKTRNLAPALAEAFRLAGVQPADHMS